VIEISPLGFVRPGARETERLAYRLWVMERSALRGRFMDMGVPVVTWRRDEPLDGVLAVATRLRRDTRLVRV
jgi:hypothetical protein